jgi:hypothetical protein
LHKNCFWFASNGGKLFANQKRQEGGIFHLSVLCRFYIMDWYVPSSWFMATFGESWTTPFSFSLVRMRANWSI